MSLLAPMFLLGSILIGVPIWLHRLKKTSADSTNFSSTMLMQESAERTHVRRAIRFRKLLSLRVLLLLLLILAFAKPFSILPGLGLSTVDMTHFVVIDTSPSMAPSMSQALTAARDIVNEIPDGQLIQVFEANRLLSPLSILSLEKNDHNGVLSDIQATDVRLDYGMLMEQLADIASDAQTPVTVHLVSDFQNSGLPANFSDLFVTGIISLETYSVDSPANNGWRVSAVRPGDEFVALDILKPEDVESFRVNWSINGSEIGTYEFDDQDSHHLPAIQDDWLVVGDNRIVVRLLEDDDLPTDNSYYFVQTKPSPVEIPILTSSAGGAGNVIFLSSALEAAPDARYVPQIVDTGRLDSRTLSRHKVILIDNLMLMADLEMGLRAYLEQGGSILAFIATDPNAQLQQLPLTGEAIAPAQLTDRKLRSVSHINTAHSVIAQTRGWFEIRVDRLPPVDEDSSAEILVALDDGSPFVSEHKIGAGRLITVAGSLGAGDNDFATKPVFAAFLIKVVEYLSGHNPIDKNVTAGEPVSLSASGQVQVTDPKGQRLLSLLETTRVNSVTLDQLGFYQLHSESEDMLVGVNLDPRESDLTPIPGEILANWRDGFANVSVPDPQIYESKGEERRREWWSYVLLALLLVGLGEAVMANTYLDVRSR